MRRSTCPRNAAFMRKRRILSCAPRSASPNFAVENSAVANFNPRMRVRPALHADLPGILDIYNEAVLNTTATYDYEPRTLEQRVAWFDERRKLDFPVFVAENQDHRIVGWSALNPFHARPGYRFTSENSVY